MKRQALMRGLISLCLMLSFNAFANDEMSREIDHILDVVAQSDCVFIRNGKEHDAADAKDHLNLKRRRGKRHFSSADEFIERLASKSSWSGKLYAIRCGEVEQAAGDWFRAVLAEYRENQ